MLIQTNLEPIIKIEEIEGKLRVINGVKKYITIKSDDKKSICIVSIRIQHFKLQVNSKNMLKLKLKLQEEFHETRK